MPRFSGIVGCGSRGDRDKKSFFRLPAELNRGGACIQETSRIRRQCWLDAIKRADLTETKKKYLWICQDHFISGKPAQLTDRNNPDWVPTRCLGYNKHGPTTSSLARYKRLKDRQAPFEHSDVHKEIEENEQEPMVLEENEQEPMVLEENEQEPMVLEEKGTADVGIQTTITMKDIEDNFMAMENYVQDICDLKSKLIKKEIVEETFRQDDERVRYYTGLNSFSLLMVVFELIAPYLSEKHNSALSKFQQLILTMMRLRLNLDFHDLAYRFSICQTTASKTFYTCLDVLYARLSIFVVWPDRDSLRCRVPPAFQQVFGARVTVIIDCFEIQIEKSSNRMAQCQTWSNYKQRNTIKYLIGICPQGTICFISNAWGGRTSDKYITENCGILDKLIPHDLILADRGFDIKDEVNLYCCEVEVPASKKNKKQLSSIEIEETRGLASVRIHVERVIGVLRQKYRILEGRMPLVLITQVSDDNICY